MKYVVILGDGMAGEPLAQLDGMTTLEYAKTPAMDALAAVSEIGLARTVPEGMKPGSDTANLSVLGYDPVRYYSGRSPLEALSIGVEMKETDVALRCNLVTLSEEEREFGKRRILDHSSDEISTQEAALLLDAVRQEFESDTYHFYVGVSYRHLLIWDHGQVQELTQPHDVLGQAIGDLLPEAPALRAMMERSFCILADHPVNLERKKKGLRPANACWFWGAGTRPALCSFQEKTGLTGAMVSAVDLLKGIAVGASMKVIEVEGANGGLHTNYEGKAKAAVDALTRDGCDFVYVHVEAPDEMGHQGSVERKVQAIEYLDSRIVAPIRQGLEQAGEEFRMLVLPDHPTPIAIRTHTGDAVPYLLYDSARPAGHGWKYNEREAAGSGRVIEPGHKLMDHFLTREG